MKKEQISSSRLKENYVKIVHPSGLTLLLCPMEGFLGTYALFAAKYGSIDTRFKTSDDKDFVTVPAGIAHFLEHKLFENEECDAFVRYAKTGASANAYTSFDRTAYLFSCTDNFKESLDILLDFVTDPYFTPETVQKEQGIIGQEIKMYEDNGDWRVFFNLLGALYHHNPVKVDIAGSIDSIARIDADLLHRCYRTFYNLGNMVLAVAGNFDIQTVLEAADRILKPAPDCEIERSKVNEPDGVVMRRVEQNLPVASPLFQIGFKAKSGETEAQTMLQSIRDEVLLDIIAGESSPLYRRLYDDGLINQTFGSESMTGRDFAINMFGGESRDPDKVYAEITADIARMQSQGIPSEQFARCKKSAYGRYIGSYSRIQPIASMMVQSHFSGLDLYAPLEAVADLTLEDINLRLKEGFNVEHSAISIVKAS